MSDFLFTVKSFADDVKRKGVYREVNPPKKIAGEPRGAEEKKDLYGDFIDMAQDNKDFSYTADLNQKHLSNLLTLKGQLKKVYMTLHRYQLPKTSARVDERAPVTRTQLYKDLTPSDNPRKIQFYELNSIVTNTVYKTALGNNIKRQVQIKQLINLLCKNAKVHSREEKLKIIIALKTYIGEIFYNVQDIITGEMQTDNISHANYSKEKSPGGTFTYNTYDS